MGGKDTLDWNVSWRETREGVGRLKKPTHSFYFEDYKLTGKAFSSQSPQRSTPQEIRIGLFRSSLRIGIRFQSIHTNLYFQKTIIMLSDSKLEIMAPPSCDISKTQVKLMTNVEAPPPNLSPPFLLSIQRWLIQSESLASSGHTDEMPQIFFFPFQSAYDLVYIADGLCRRQVKGERTPSELTPATSLQKRVLCLRVPKFMT